MSTPYLHFTIALSIIDVYWESDRDLLDPKTPLDLDEPEWPIFTYGVQRMSTYVQDSAGGQRAQIAARPRIPEGAHVKPGVQQ